MKVICVKPIVTKANSVINCPHPQVGDIDTVTEVYEEFGASYFCLLGYPGSHIFITTCFATLPSESEEVAIEAESEGLIYQR